MKLLFLASILAIASAPLIGMQSNKTQEGVFIAPVSEEAGPMFYPASYSTNYTAEPNYSTQNSYGYQNLNFSEAYKNLRGDSVKVAIIDSGLNYTHEDFIVSGNRIINGQSRAIDSTSGEWLYYQYSKGYQTKLDDSLGHGTNVAACVASAINSVGGAGIAPNVDLYVYKVSNTSNGYEWTAINSALQYCIDEGIDIINMSFQSYENAVSYGSSSMGASSGCSSVLTTKINACYNAGIVMVAASGNFNTTEPSYPANNNHVISVGSLAQGSSTTKAGYSNYGHNDLVAPGTVYVADESSDSAYVKTQGTSFSAPIVTGAIALYKQAYPDATVDEITEVLYNSCDNISGADSWQGNGRLNIGAFLNIDDYVPVESVSFTNLSSTTELHVGDQLQLEWEVLPANATNKNVTFTSVSDLVTISDTGLLTVVGEGEDMIGITSTVDPSIEDIVEIEFLPATDIPATAISLDKSSLTLKKGEYYTLTPTITPNNTTDALSYTSNNTSVATVNSAGKITAVNKGTATITATVGSVSATCTVTVTDITGIELTGKTTYKLKETYSTSNYTVKAIYSDSSEVDVTSSATIGTIDTTILGKQTLTATYGDFADTLEITVTNNGTTEDVGVDVPETLEDKETSYLFTSKSWGTSSSAWISGKDGAGYLNNGVQVTSGYSGANATSDTSFSNVSKVVVSYCTNSKDGIGSIGIKIGSNTEVSQSVTKSGGTTARNLTYNFSTKQTGTVKITVTCTSNSIYIKGITITYQVGTPGVSYLISPEEQAIAWAKYFNGFTATYCDTAGVNSNTTGLLSIWTDVKNEYEYMSDLSKDALIDSSDTNVTKALTVYRLIITKYSGFTNFIVDKNGDPLSLNNHPFNVVEVNDAALVAIVISLTLSFTFLAYFKKRKVVSK